MIARLFRSLAGALALVVIAVPAASAQVPLTGTGENLQPIARMPISHPNEIELAGDWAFVSNDLNDNDDEGLIILNIADPAKPFVEGRWLCDGGWADVDVSPDGNLAVLTNAHNTSGSNGCTDDTATVALIDTTDKRNPKLLSTIPYDAEMDYIHTATLDNKWLLLNPQAAAIAPAPENLHIPLYDISDPTKPVRKGFIEGRGAGLAHDTYVDHRPDGKTLLYSGSVHTSDVFDITDPLAPVLLQQQSSPEITISHDVQPNHKRDMIIVDDEGAAGGQLSETVSVCGKFGGPGPAAIDSGSVHFYAAAPDGTFANGGAVELGSWNAPPNANTGACVAHVFWQAPDENRLTQAYYRTGVFVLDFEDPANAKMLGDFHAEGGGNYWSAKPHRGYLFATNQDSDGSEGKGGSVDILRYTGEGGKRWPATAGPAEVQRAARQGVPYKPLVLPGSGTPVGTAPLPGAQGGADSRAIGRVAFTARLKRLPGRKGKKVRLTFTFTDAKGRRVGTASVRKAAGRAARVRIFGGAVAGRYRWTVKAGRRTLKRGSFRVTRLPGQVLAPNRTLSVGAR